MQISAQLLCLYMINLIVHEEAEIYQNTGSVFYAHQNMHKKVLPVCAELLQKSGITVLKMNTNI